MYSFFELSGSTGVRLGAAAGSLIITVVIMASAFVPASPAIALPVGVLA